MNEPTPIEGELLQPTPIERKRGPLPPIVPAVTAGAMVGAGILFAALIVPGIMFLVGYVVYHFVKGYNRGKEKLNDPQ